MYVQIYVNMYYTYVHTYVHAYRMCVCINKYGCMCMAIMHALVLCTAVASVMSI